MGSREQRLRTYHNVFVADEAVDWLVEHYPVSRRQAVRMMCELQQQVPMNSLHVSLSPLLSHGIDGGCYLAALLLALESRMYVFLSFFRSLLAACYILIFCSLCFSYARSMLAGLVSSRSQRGRLHRRTHLLGVEGAQQQQWQSVK